MGHEQVFSKNNPNILVHIYLVSSITSFVAYRKSTRRLSRCACVASLHGLSHYADVLAERRFSCLSVSERFDVLTLGPSTTRGHLFIMLQQLALPYCRLKLGHGFSNHRCKSFCLVHSIPCTPIADTQQACIRLLSKQTFHNPAHAFVAHFTLLSTYWGGLYNTRSRPTTLVPGLLSFVDRNPTRSYCMEGYISPLVRGRKFCLFLKTWWF